MAAQDPGGRQTGLPFYEKLGFARTGTETGHGGQEFALYEKKIFLAILMDKVLTSCLRSGNMGFINLTRVIGGECHAPIP